MRQKPDEKQCVSYVPPVLKKKKKNIKQLYVCACLPPVKGPRDPGCGYQKGETAHGAAACLGLKLQAREGFPAHLWPSPVLLERDLPGLRAKGPVNIQILGFQT